MENLKEVLKNFKSRKVILLVVGIITAIMTFMQKTVGVSMDATAALSGLVVVVAYLFGEGKMDFKRVKTGIVQGGKWKDSAFWTSLAASLLPVFNEALGINIPVEMVNSVIAIVIGFVFSKRAKNVESAV